MAPTKKRELLTISSPGKTESDDRGTRKTEPDDAVQGKLSQMIAVQSVQRDQRRKSSSFPRFLAGIQKALAWTPAESRGGDGVGGRGEGDEGSRRGDARSRGGDGVGGRGEGDEGSRGSGGVGRRYAGITVIELMVALAIVGLISLVGLNVVKRVRKSDLREDAVQVAATLRSAASMAMQSGMMHRVVFQLTDKQFRIEACERSIKLSWDKALVAETQEEQQETEPHGLDLPEEFLSVVPPDQLKRMTVALSGSHAGGTPCRAPTLPNGDSDGRGSKRTMKAGIHVPRIFVQHRSDPQRDGAVAIHFFPLGRAEKAIVEVANEDGDTYSLLVHGLTGRVEFRNGELRDPEEHMMRDAVGNKVEEP